VVQRSRIAERPCHAASTTAKHPVTYSGFSIHDGTLLHSKSQYTTVKTQPATLRTHVHVRPVWSRNTHSYRILPTGPLVAIFQHSLSFLQSESFQTHVGTIHRRAIGPLAHHGTSAYSPSLTCHLPAPTHKHVCPRTILKPH
jgi:hypothetical protein